MIFRSLLVAILLDQRLQKEARCACQLSMIWELGIFKYEGRLSSFSVEKGGHNEIAMCSAEDCSVEISGAA